METRYIRTRWTTAELEQLSASLTDGLGLHILEELIPNRSPKAILKKALEYGYSSKTVDGNIIMKLGVNRRRGRRRGNQQTVPIETATTTELEPRVATHNTVLTTASESTNQQFHDAIIPYITSTNAIDVNNLAIKMLQNNNLLVTSETIFKQSAIINLSEEQLCVS